MENKIKRFLSLMLAFVMVLGMMPMTVFAVETDELGDTSDSEKFTLYFNNYCNHPNDMGIYLDVAEGNDLYMRFYDSEWKLCAEHKLERTEAPYIWVTHEVEAEDLSTVWVQVFYDAGNIATGVIATPTAGGMILSYSHDDQDMVWGDYASGNYPKPVPKAAQVGEDEFVSLTDAVAAANAIEGGATVTLLKDVTLGEKLTVSGNVTIKGEHTITRADSYTGTLFAVNAGAVLTLDGGLVIDGGNNWTLSEQYQTDLERDAIGTAWADYVIPEEGAPSATAPMIKVGGSLIAKDVTIQNHLSTGSSNSGAYSVIQLTSNATLLTEGAKFYHNTTSGANAVAYVSSGATWTINDGTVISGNFAGKNGGISRIDNGTVVMNGGLIEKNGSYNTNGTVFMFYGAKAQFDMNGGTICGNSGVAGGQNGYNAAVYIHDGAKLDMSAGTICHNIGRTCGGIDAPYTSEADAPGNASTVSISGGNVWYNSSARYGEHTNLLRFADRATITGGWYSSDPSEWVAVGYVVFIHEGMGENGETLYEVGKAVAYNVDDEKYFADLSDALDVADSGETVQLLKTWYEELVLVPAGVTFDLNGNVVETENTLSFGIVMDSQKEVGGIKISIDTTKAFTKLQPVNGGYLPIYDTEAGMYKFFAYDVESYSVIADTANNSVTFRNRVVFDNVAGYEVLANTDNSGIDFVLTMDWTGMSGFGLRFHMSASNLKQYAQKAYDQLNDEDVNTKVMTGTVHGISVLDSGAFISAAPSVETIAEVTDSAAAQTYNIP